MAILSTSKYTSISLILYLLGIDENYKYKESTDDLSTLLRAGIIAGSSTSTAITYKRSNDEYIYIDGEKLVIVIFKFNIDHKT